MDWLVGPAACEGLGGDGPEVGRRHGRRGGLVIRVHGALPAQNAAFVDDQGANGDVAVDLAGGQELEPAGGLDIALDAAADHDVSGGDVALDAAMLAHGQVTVGADIAGHLTVKADVGAGMQAALQLDLVAEHGLGRYGNGFAAGSGLEHGWSSCWL